MIKIKALIAPKFHYRFIPLIFIYTIFFYLHFWDWVTLSFTVPVFKLHYFLLYLCWIIPGFMYAIYLDEMGNTDFARYGDYAQVAYWGILTGSLLFFIQWQHIFWLFPFILLGFSLLFHLFACFWYGEPFVLPITRQQRALLSRAAQRSTRAGLDMSRKIALTPKKIVDANQHTILVRMVRKYF